MNKKFENIDDLFQSKINELTEEDVLFREGLIWDKIEIKLEKKHRLIPIWWQYGMAACLLILLGFWFLNQSKVIVKSEVSIKPESKPEIMIQSKIEAQKLKKTKINQSKKSTKNIESKSLKFEVESIEIAQNIDIKNPEIALTNIEFNPKSDSSISLTNTKNFRVIHLDEFNKKPIEIIKESKSFYVRFNSEFIEKSNQNSPFELKIPIKSSKF